MTVRAGPSGPVAIRVASVFYDWGIVAPGMLQASIPYTPPPGQAVEISTLGPFPADCFGLAVWSTSLAGFFAQAFNGSGFPVNIGVIEYAAILTEIKVAR